MVSRSNMKLEFFPRSDPRCILEVGMKGVGGSAAPSNGGEKAPIPEAYREFARKLIGASELWEKHQVGSYE
jgi:hypothetical protein